MEVLNYTEFRRNLAKSVDTVNDNADTLIVSRSKGRNVVVISLAEYNSIMETLQPVKSGPNRKRLQDATDEMYGYRLRDRKLNSSAVIAIHDKRHGTLML